MGNICCDDDPQPHPTMRHLQPRLSNARTQAKSETQTRIEQQKNLLSDFSPALHYLSLHAEKGAAHRYKGYYVHNSIGSDESGEYLIGTLLEEDGTEFECVVKRIDKDHAAQRMAKKQLAIEYQVTRYLDHPFIVSCLHFHQDASFLYLFFDLAGYQTLSAFTSITTKPQHYTLFHNELENNIRFIVAGIILALQQLHELRLVYRGINNQNILILDNGYPLLTRLTLLHPQGRCCPNPVTVTPFTSLEEYRGQPLACATDLWDLGVLIHYICTGSYINFTTFKQRQFRPPGISPQLTDLVNRLLLLKPQSRIGAQHFNDIKSHSFFKDFKWQAYQNQQLPSPLAISTTNLRHDPVSRQYGAQNSFYCDGSNGMMAAFLFLDVAAIYMLSSALQSGGHPEINVLPPETNHLQDEHQLATEIDIADYNQYQADVGGDYD